MPPRSPRPISSGLRRPTGSASAAALLGLVDPKGPPAEILSIQRGDRCVRRLRLVHLDEGEATGSSRLSIHDHVDGGDGSVAPEGLTKLVCRGGEGDVSDVESFAHRPPTVGAVGARAERTRIGFHAPAIRRENLASRRECDIGPRGSTAAPRNHARRTPGECALAAPPPFELEIKLALPDEAAWRALRDALRSPTVVHQENHFFDTDDRALDRARIGVRLRVTGETIRLTVKADADAGSASAGAPGEANRVDAPLTRRVELEATISRDRFDRAMGQSLELGPWLAQWRQEPHGGDLPVRALLERLAALAPLRRFGSFTNERTTGRLPLRRGTADDAPVDEIEVELDRTTFPGDHVEHELEVELDAATPRDEALAIERAVHARLEALGIEARAAPSKLARFRARLDRPGG